MDVELSVRAENAHVHPTARALWGVILTSHEMSCIMVYYIKFLVLIANCTDKTDTNLKVADLLPTYHLVYKR